MFAIKLSHDGSVSVVTPHDNDGSILGWLQDQVGGFIETVSPRIQIPFEYKLIVNEEGKNMRLPHNARASIHMARSYGVDFIAGECIIVKIATDEDGEQDLATLSAEEVVQLMRVIE